MKAKSRTINKRRNRILILVFVVIAAVAGYFYYTRTMTPEEVTETASLQTTTVRKGDIVIKANGSGNLLPSSEIELGFRNGGTLIDLTVSVGDAVEAGQILARMDSASAQIQVSQAELNLEQTQARLAETQAGLTETLAIAQANVDAAQADYDAIIKGTLYTGDRLTSARVNLEQATEQLALAQQAYTTAWDPGRDWELDVRNRAAALENERVSTLRSLEKAKDDLAIARANYNLAVLNTNADSSTQASLVKLLTAQRTLDEVLSGADVQSANWALRQSELALDSAKLAVDSAVLRAPVSGTVVKIDASTGESVGTNPIITIADLNTPVIRFYLDESELSKVTVGNPVLVVFDALPDQQYPGSIVQIEPALVTVDGTAAIQAWASLDTSAGPTTLPIGLTAEVEIIAGEAYKTLLVPVQALRELAPGQYAVFVVDEMGELKLRSVEVGLRDFANAQILNGLSQGETISTGTVETE